ncbi:uncharacterized protein [Lolium perenne]|uniref:uncharacterized protein n=1 Tax=Lolium perenne TaxID=4522 RepID=UPI003A995CF3
MDCIYLARQAVHPARPSIARRSRVDRARRQLTIAKEDVREEPASEGVAEGETASKKLPLRKNKDKRSELVQVKKEKQLGSSHKTQLPVVAEEPKEDVREELNKEKLHRLDVAEEEVAPEWHASYSVRLRKHHLRRIYKGSVLLDAEVNRLLLYDIDESFIDEYYLKEGEMIYPGATFSCPCHKVEIGEPIFQSKEDIPLPTNNATRTKEERRDEKNRKRLKRKRPDENLERTSNLKKVNKKMMRSPQAKLLRSSIGRFARVASLRKGMSPQAQQRKSESPSVPNVTVHFPSPNLPRAKANSSRFRPRKLKSRIWKEFIPIYEDGKLAEEELFEDIVQQLGIICEKEPSLDIVTRWNSTYLMIDSALPYKEAFYELVEQDRQFKYAPSADDWKMAEAIRSLLKVFFEATKVVSGCSYPTSNRYFHEMWGIKLLLEKHANNKEKVIASMVSEMQKKFNKYWKESYLANCIPVILDPRYKFEFVKFRIRQAFGDNAAEHLEKVDMTMKSLFKDYSLGESFVDPSEEVDVDEVAEIDNPLADWEAHLRVQKKQATNELDRYLSEDLYPQEKDFDILGWWKLHSPKYPVLSCIARDVLAIQASTVASESSFSAGGRTISDQRNRLKSDTVEALICLQDWLKADDPKTTNKDVEEEEYLVFYQESECHEETEPTDN